MSKTRSSEKTYRFSLLAESPVEHLCLVVTNVPSYLCYSMQSFVKINSAINFDVSFPSEYKTNTQITKELKITQILDKLLEYKRNWIQHVNRMPHNTRRLPSVITA